MVENLPASAGVIRDMGSIPGSGRSPGGGRGSPLQCSRLENPGQRSLVGCSLQGCGELGVTEGTERAHVVLSPLGGASGAPGNAGPLCLGAGRVQ